MHVFLCWDGASLSVCACACVCVCAGNLSTPLKARTLKYNNGRQAVSSLTQSMGEHVVDKKRGVNAIILKKNMVEENPFLKRVEEVTAHHCAKYQIDIDPAMHAMLNWSNNSIKKHLPNGKWDASVMAYPYCAYLYALRNSWSHPKNRPVELTNQIILAFCLPYWYQLVPEYEKIKRDFGVE